MAVFPTNGVQKVQGDIRSPEDLDPGLPYPEPCLSFWLGQTRQQKLIGYRSTEDIPAEVDVAISLFALLLLAESC